MSELVERTALTIVSELAARFKSMRDMLDHPGLTDAQKLEGIRYVLEAEVPHWAKG